MDSLKSLVYDICSQVATEFSGWKFVSGEFKRLLVGHTELIINPGFFFERGFSNLEPFVGMRNKKFEKFFKLLVDSQDRQAIPVSTVSFQFFQELLVFTPEPMRRSCLICLDKESYVTVLRESNRNEEKKAAMEAAAVGVDELRPVLVAMMKDGIAFIESHYDLSSEENLLRQLPVKYTPLKKVPYAELEKSAGLIFCAVRLMLGDFAFIESYVSDSYKTIYPKRMVELNKIIEKLPMLKIRYAETGSVL